MTATEILAAKADAAVGVAEEAAQKAKAYRESGVKESMDSWDWEVKAAAQDVAAGKALKEAERALAELKEAGETEPRLVARYRRLVAR